ncbi:DNA polymerase-3 subunit chi [Erythrobacter litoralis]|jgi:DNA polymerase-3 subunit chi|uniref:DNA polymerase III subunit chi n=1 Tax=Erythrobacter litoralis TaxID=39960 RepID=A0A074MI38_9SPHN|nr:DNA polymerase III subunit chi [Erythrobacter litoralis]AOL23020.1 DNA polymerase-3 subunit chi [Erythrobacter litoralis]KEO93114.1 DNA polymerase III subunit chi [Erythrobacter litoralis]MEE4338448.1 DNA polymerase III subunit chi [Erythrobacter sp.]
MKVDFWQLSRDPAPRVVALIAARVLAQGERLLVVSDDAEQRQMIANALWSAAPDSFLANAHAGSAGDERQPILLSAECAAPNGANHVVFADGTYRDAEGFDRLFLLFGEDTLEAARGTWRSLDGRDGIERSFFRQDDGKWTKIA